MSLLTLSAKLDRTDSGTSWGFRLYGGKDFGTPLTIQRVTPGSLAAKCGLQVGDLITRIGDAPAEGMFHKEAQQRIIQSGNSLELNLERGGGPGRPVSHVAAPVAAEQPPSAFSPVQQQQQQQQQPSQPVYKNPTPRPFGSAPSSEQSPSWHGSQPAGPPPGPPGGGYQAPAAPAAPSPGVWKPNIPSGPRHMKVGRAGDARSMPAPSTGTRIPICGTCGIAIRGPFVSALDKTWCPDHFICANPQCHIPLLNIGFVEEAGELFCEKDYAQYFAPRCHKCATAIIGEIVNAQMHTYHMGCFTCCKCHQPIGAGSFNTEDGKVYCPRDWAAMFQTKCSGCQFPIEPGDRWVEALNENWHSECFNCSTCQVNLEGQSFFAKGGKPYCKKHAR